MQILMLVGMIIGAIFAIAVICMPFFIWGIYKSNLKQEELLEKQNRILLKANNLELVNKKKKI